ncbi:MAG: LemA family protein [Candidatus Anstonellaceae archaeon]
MLQNNLNQIENELVHERKVYNKRVSLYNVKLQEFPSILVAKLFGFREKEFFLAKEFEEKSNSVGD